MTGRKSGMILGVFLLLLNVVTGQKDVVLVEEKAGKQIRLFLLNKTKQEQDVQLTVEYSGCTSSEAKQVARKLAAAEKSYVMTLNIVQGTPCMYRSSIQITGETPYDPASPNLPVLATPVSELVENQVNIFTKKGCSRCKYVLDQLKARKIAFKEFDTSGVPAHNLLMFDLLRQNGYSKNSVDMPVVLSKGKIEYNLANLDQWVQSQR